MKEGGLINIKKIAEIYYGGKKPDNINLYFLKEEQYKKKYKELTKKIFGNSDNGYENTCGYCIHDKESDVYHILIKDYNQDYKYSYIINLFHELAHTDTMPGKIGVTLLCSSKKKDDVAITGYEFWKEYIAQYEAVNKFQMNVGNIAFLHDNELTKSVLKELLNNYLVSLYEIVLYSEITGIFIDGTEEETKNLISVLKNIKNRFVSREDIKTINKRELRQIGKGVALLLGCLSERKNHEE